MRRRGREDEKCVLLGPNIDGAAILFVRLRRIQTQGTTGKGLRLGVKVVDGRQQPVVVTVLQAVEPVTVAFEEGGVVMRNQLCLDF